MDMWIITVGWHDDLRIIGVATSPEQAEEMVTKARLSGEFTHLEYSGGENTYDVTGPFAPDQVYGYNRQAL